MDASNSDLSAPLSLQQLFEELENLIVLETQISRDHWVISDRLIALFYEKHKASPEVVAKAQGYSGKFRSLLASSNRFSIYGTPEPQKFYVALLQSVVPTYQLSLTPIQYQLKRPWKVNKRLLKMLKSEGAEEIPFPASRYHSEEREHYPVPSCPAQNALPQKPVLVSEINSVHDLTLALIEIIKSWTTNNSKKSVTIGILSQNFQIYYQQPIRPVLRKVCPGVKLIELLQTIPNLQVEQVEGDWQITVADLQG